MFCGSLDEFSKNWPVLEISKKSDSKYWPVPRYFKKQSESKNWPVPGIQTPQRTGDFHERTGERASYISISSV